MGGYPRLALLPPFLRVELRGERGRSALFDSWMGHQTLDMARRYAHLFPNVAKTALNSVFE